MISKQYRLSENEVKKVLRFRKPFFAHGFIANILPNKVGHNRFGIVFSAKHTKTSIARNFYRRRLYDTLSEIMMTGSHDIVFVPKKGKTFHHKNPEDISNFDRDIGFLKKFVRK